MTTTITLDLTASTVQHGDRVAAVSPRAARFLRALTLCGSGFLSDHLVGLSEDTIQQSMVSPLRTALRVVGVTYSIERARGCDIQGFYLLPGLEVVAVGERRVPHTRDPELIANVMHLRAAGVSFKAIGARLGINYATAWQIALRHHPHTSSATAVTTTHASATAAQISTTRIAQSSTRPKDTCQDVSGSAVSQSVVMSVSSFVTQGT